MMDRRAVWTHGVWFAALALGLSLVLAGTAAARDIEVRGTLLCRENYDPLRERPAELPCLLVRADQYPRIVEIVETSGLFRLRIPSNATDRPLVIRVFRGEKEIHAFRVHVEPGRFVRQGDVEVLSVGAHLLPQSCEDLYCTLDVGLAGREALLASAPEESHSRRKIATFLSPVLLLIPGAIAAGGSTDMSAGIGPVGGGPFDVIQPGTWPEYARATASPAIGRSLTSPRHPDETALWNPSALALDGTSGIAAGWGSMNTFRGSAWYSGPEKWRDRSPFLPRVISAGYTRFSVNGSWGEGEDERLFDLEEALFVAGLGFGIGERVGVSGSIRRDEIRDEIPGEDGQITTQDITDFDVAATVDATHWLRLAAAGYALAGEEIDDDFWNSPMNPRTFVVQAAVSWQLMHAGIETSVDDEGGHVAAGASFRPFSQVLIDIGGGSRNHSVQMGFETILGPARIGFRVRQDDFDAFQYHVYTAFTH